MRRKYLTDAVFIVITTLILLILEELNWLEKLHDFILIPIIAAYFIGKWSGTRIKKVD